MPKNLLNINWYQNLLEDLKKIAWTRFVELKHTIGKRILEDELKFEKSEYGSKRIENLAKDLNTSSSDLYACIQFATKFPTLSENLKNESWRNIIHKFLPIPKKQSIIAELPKGKYKIIYADPAWQYYEGGFKNQSQHYKTMELEEIKNLPISNLAADNCILFLWATRSILPDAIDVLRAWGFEYSTMGFVWVKSKQDGTGFAFGLGNRTRANAEYCLIGIKGSIETKDKSISEIVYTPSEEHSKKPDIIRDKIVQLVGDLPKIELFARQKVGGWDSWGQEI